jgi:plastocyanin
MHVAALHLVPILGAEKSKVPFYIAGGALVVWALIVSLGLGLRRPDFPGGTGGERTVIAITVVLVIAAASTAVITSGTPAKTASAANAASTQTTQTSPTATGEASPATTAATPTASTPASPPTATTGTPTPPSSPAGGATTALKLAADPGGQLSYNTKQLAAKAGKVTITMTNMSPLEHDVAVAQGSKVLGVTPTFQGGSRTLTMSLKPGTYTFYCTVPGHRQAGMEGTLTVSA